MESTENTPFNEVLNLMGFTFSYKTPYFIELFNDKLFLNQYFVLFSLYNLDDNNGILINEDGSCSTSIYFYSPCDNTFYQKTDFINLFYSPSILFSSSVFSQSFNEEIFNLKPINKSIASKIYFNLKPCSRDLLPDFIDENSPVSLNLHDYKNIYNSTHLIFDKKTNILAIPLYNYNDNLVNTIYFNDKYFFSKFPVSSYFILNSNLSLENAENINIFFNPFLLFDFYNNNSLLNSHTIVLNNIDKFLYYTISKYFPSNPNITFVLENNLQENINLLKTLCTFSQYNTTFNKFSLNCFISSNYCILESSFNDIREDDIIQLIFDTNINLKSNFPHISPDFNKIFFNQSSNGNFTLEFYLNNNILSFFFNCFFNSKIFPLNTHLNYIN